MCISLKFAFRASEISSPAHQIDWYYTHWHISSTVFFSVNVLECQWLIIFNDSSFVNILYDNAKENNTRHCYNCIKAYFTATSKHHSIEHCPSITRGRTFHFLYRLKLHWMNCNSLVIKINNNNYNSSISYWLLTQSMDIKLPCL